MTDSDVSFLGAGSRIGDNHAIAEYKVILRTWRHPGDVQRKPAVTVRLHFLVFTRKPEHNLLLTGGPKTKADNISGDIFSPQLLQKIFELICRSV